MSAAASGSASANPSAGPSSSASGPFAAYRPPVLGVVQPGAGAAVPQDRPVVGLRFALQEPGDVIDPSSFGLSVDGRDRSAAFQVTTTNGAAGEVWGTLADATGASAPPLTPGPHRVRARVCSVRGVCTALETTVSVVVEPLTTGTAARTGSRPRQLVGAVAGALLDLGRRLATP